MFWRPLEKGLHIVVSCLNELRQFHALLQIQSTRLLRENISDNICHNFSLETTTIHVTKFEEPDKTININRKK